MRKARDAIAAREDDQLLVRADADHRYDRRALAERELEEALAPAKDDLAAIAEGAKRVEVGSGIHEDAVPGGERAVRAVVAGTKHPEALRVRAQDGILEEEVVRQRVHAPLAAAVIADGERGEEAVAGHERAVVVRHEERGAAGRNVLHALHAQAEVARAERAPEVEEEVDQVGIERVQIVGVDAPGVTGGARDREAREAGHETRRREEDAPILARDEAPRAGDPPERAHPATVATPPGRTRRSASGTPSTAHKPRRSAVMSGRSHRSRLPARFSLRPVKMAR